jgi:hypothetical protein
MTKQDRLKNYEENKTKVSQDTLDAVNLLIEQLNKEFGVNYSFSILGRGHFIAMSNVEGVIKAELNPESVPASK